VRASLTGTAALVLLAIALACSSPAVAAGKQRPPRWPAATCRAQAAKVSDRAQRMLRHYSGMVYPADVEYMLLRNAFRRFVSHRCAPSILGRALRRELSDRQRLRLTELLPAELARSFRRALAASQPAG
jgi:hypothetical protein